MDLLLKVVLMILNKQLKELLIQKTLNKKVHFKATGNLMYQFVIEVRHFIIAYYSCLSFKYYNSVEKVLDI